MRFEVFLLAAAADFSMAQWGKGRRRPPWWQTAQQQTTAAPVQQPTRVQNPPAGATQSVWGQCGGRTYSGATACPLGNYCHNDGNEWYSQCVPNDYKAPAQGGNQNGPVVTRTLTTIFSYDDPLPTRVTTYITILQPITTLEQPQQPVQTWVPDEPYRPPRE